jgi:hypothetical membrane protein
MPLQKVGLWCGIIGPVLWLALIATAGILRPDFSHVTDYISELGERGSTTEALMRYGAFGFTGVLYLCFAAALRDTFRGGWLDRAATVLLAFDGVGRIGAGVFPCDPGCAPASLGPDLHRLFAAVGFGSGTLATFFWGLVLRRVSGLRSLWSFSLGCGAVASVSLLLMLWAPGTALPSGLPEHVATVALSIWVLVFAGRLLWVEHPASVADPVRRAG